VNRFLDKNIRLETCIPFEVHAVSSAFLAMLCVKSTSMFIHRRIISIVDKLIAL